MALKLNRDVVEQSHNKGMKSSVTFYLDCLSHIIVLSVCTKLSVVHDA